MLALLITFLGALFFLGPDLISRWVLGFVVPRRNLSQSRGEEVTRAAIWAAGPLVLAFIWVNVRHVLGMWGSSQDVETAVAGLYSSSYFDANRVSCFNSTVRTAGMCLSVLWRLYLIVGVIAVMLNFVIMRYRWWRNRWTQRWARSILATLVLPRISEWHILLSDMLLPKDDVFLAVDVLTKNGTLYQGRVADRMLGSDGTLQTVTLADPRRFLREDFKKAKELDVTTRTDKFWRDIPSKLFVILGSDVTSVNIRYPPKTTSAPALNKVELNQQELEAVRNLLAKLTSPVPSPDPPDSSSD